MRVLVINNLHSGYADGSIHDFIRSFSEAGDEVVYRVFMPGRKLPQYLKDAKDFDQVVVSGDDGFVAGICYHLRNTKIQIFPFPGGTGNLLATNIDMPNEPFALAKIAREMRTLDFDSGELRFGDKVYGFNVIAGCGYDAAIMKSAKPNKKIFGMFSYYLAAVRNALPQCSHFEIMLDNKTIHAEGIGVLVINFSRLQGDLTITHENKPRDSVFDVVILKGKSAFKLLPAVWASVLDVTGLNPNRTDSLEIYQAKHIVVKSDPEVEVQFDGKADGYKGTFEAQILPHSTRLVLSEEAFKKFK
ncbi:MAG: diacylglycerol kinase [Eggerthellaceae bacterium]|nr:diacylglycerol kinase [Eggerthellaceae bacterium]